MSKRNSSKSKPLSQMSQSTPAHSRPTTNPTAERNKHIETRPTNPTNEENTVENQNQDLQEMQEDEIDIAKKKGMMAYPKVKKTPSRGSSKPKIMIVKEEEGLSSSGSDIILPVPIRMDYKTRQRRLSVPSQSCSPIDASFSESSSNTFSDQSLANSITRFRDDFDELKCKMRIFGESLNLCRCIAHDFKSKLGHMERRLVTLERRERISMTASNYSAIIKKNKDLANKTKDFVKKLQMCGTEEEMREVAARLCKDYLYGSWKTVKPEELQFRRVSGGLSNYIYYVALPESTESKQFKLYSADPDCKGIGSPSEVIDEPRKVLLRIYGQIHGERAMDAIVTESVIFTLLSERRLGPKLYGVFSGGRIEEYIPARSLLTRELSEPAISMKIAEKTAAIHSMDIPLSKEPNWLWKTAARWLKTCRDERLAPNAKGKDEEEEEIINRLRKIDFEKEIEWVKKLVATVDSPVVFCHNDLQEGNILILEDEAQTTHDEFEPSYVHTYDTPASSKDNNTAETGTNNQNPTEEVCHHSEKVYHRSLTYIEPAYDDTTTSDTVITRMSDNDEPRLVLIDFEYCAYNYRGFDIANHMAEWAYDYTNPTHPFYLELTDHWPTLEQKEIFIKEYLKHYNAVIEGKEPTEPSIDAVNKLLTEVEAFTLASHLFWTLWSIVNASKSQIPFGYWVRDYIAPCLIPLQGSLLPWSHP